MSTFCSTTGVDAVLAGVPTVAHDAGSMVAGVTPGMKRLPWLSWLAYTQWTYREMEEGKPWLALME